MLVDHIRESSTETLQAMLSAMADAARAGIVKLETSVKNALIEELTDKLSFHKTIPYSAIGMIWGELPGGDHVKAKAIAKANVEEYDEIIAAGKGDKVHRVGHRLYSKAGRIRYELDQWINSTIENLRAFATAFVAVLQYALIPVVGRNVEAVHARLKRILQRCTYMKPPGIAAAVRLDQTLELLRKCVEFMMFCVQHWRSRTMLDDVLDLVVSRSDRQALSRVEKIRRVYQCALEDEYRDMTEERTQQLSFLDQTSHTRRGPPRGYKVPAKQCLLYLKVTFANDPDFVFSLPEDIFQVMAAPMGGPVELDGEYIDQVCAAVTQPEVPYDMGSVGATVFFFVINNQPEKRHLVSIDYEDHDIDHIKVSKCLVIESDAERQTVTLSASPGSTTISVAPLIADVGNLLPKLYRWAVAKKGSEQTARIAQPMLEDRAVPVAPALPGTIALAPQVAHLAIAGPPVDQQLALRPLDDATCAKIIATVREACARNESGWAELLGLDDVDLVDVGRLAGLGALEARADDFGIISVQPRDSGMRWMSCVTVHDALQAMRVDTYSENSKLDMCLHLIRHGWLADPDPVAVTPQGPLSFLLDVRRPASYFIALLHTVEIQQKQVQEIHHLMPDNYYRSLMRLTPAQIATMLQAGETSDEWFRKNLRESLTSGGQNIILPGDDDEEDVPQPAALPAVPYVALNNMQVWRRCTVSEPGGSASGAVTYKVYFDTAHHTGRPRGLIQCRNPNHGECIKHVHSDTYDSRSVFAATLFVWATMCGHFETKESHLAFTPTTIVAQDRLPALTINDF